MLGPELLVIRPRIPIRRGAGLFCECGGRIVLDGYGEHKCFACGWDHWDLRPDADQVPIPPPTPRRHPIVEEIEGENRVRCYTCAFVWVLECEQRVQGVCPACGTKKWRSPNYKPIRLCNEPGCNAVSSGKGRCASHNRRLRRMRDRQRKMQEEKTQ